MRATYTTCNEVLIDWIHALHIVQSILILIEELLLQP